jgi:intein/homing endonuclease
MITDIAKRIRNRMVCLVKGHDPTLNVWKDVRTQKVGDRTMEFHRNVLYVEVCERCGKILKKKIARG